MIYAPSFRFGDPFIIVLPFRNERMSLRKRVIQGKEPLMKINRRREPTVDRLANKNTICK
jgi:hypothetical protein